MSQRLKRGGTGATGYINSLSHTHRHADDEGGEGTSCSSKDKGPPIPSRRRYHRRSAKLGALTPPHAIPHRQSPLHDLNFTPNFFLLRQPAITEKKIFHEATDYRFPGVIGPLNSETQVRANLASIVLSSLRFLSLNPPDLFYSCVTLVTVSTTTKIHFFHAALDPSHSPTSFTFSCFADGVLGLTLTCSLFLFSLSVFESCLSPLSLIPDSRSVFYCFCVIPFAGGAWSQESDRQILLILVCSKSKCSFLLSQTQTHIKT